MSRLKMDLLLYYVDMFASKIRMPWFQPPKVRKSEKENQYLTRF